MLDPNSIPEQEPDIRVGIVLPEDKQKNITINIPADADYLLIDENEQIKKLKENNQINFEIFGDSVKASIGTSFSDQSKKWSLTPVSSDYKIKEKAGAKVQQVISGRSFHWKKNIDVFLPGKIEISPADDSLMLINELPIEQYLMCVATSEMGAACPPALIESQTIVARAWMLANVEQKHRHLGFDVCNDDCCQRYQGTNNLSEQSIKGAQNTYGQVLMYDEEICDSRYSKSCGGVMETFDNVWGGQSLPYMKPLPDAEDDFSNDSLPLDSEEKVKKWIDSVPKTFCSPKTIPEDELQQYLGSVDEEGSYFRWTFEYSQNDLTDLLNKKCELEAEAIKAIEPVRRGFSGRLIEVRVIFKKYGELSSIIIEDQYRIRECFHESFLYSSAFYVETEGETEVPGKFILHGAGWGHGAGYCQIGAVGMALEGYSTEDIVYHYFPGAKLNKIY